MFAPRPRDFFGRQLAEGDRAHLIGDLTSGEIVTFDEAGEEALVLFEPESRPNKDPSIKWLRARLLVKE